MVFTQVEENEEALLEIVEELNSGCALVLYNDDVNTFDWVIECLVKYCNHEENQAEQCAMLVHYKGKCTVKTGALSKLKPICEALLDNDLSAKIEEI